MAFGAGISVLLNARTAVPVLPRGISVEDAKSASRQIAGLVCHFCPFDLAAGFSSGNFSLVDRL
jgi:hypothetical protein